MGVTSVVKTLKNQKTYEELNKNVIVGLNNLIKVVVRQNNDVRRLGNARQGGESQNKSENNLHF